MKLISTTFCFIARMIILLSINQSFNDVLEWGCMLHHLKVMNEFFRRSDSVHLIAGIRLGVLV